MKRKVLIIVLSTAFILSNTISQQVVIDHPDIITGVLVKTTKPLRDVTPADTIPRTFPRQRGLKLGYHLKHDWILHQKVNPNALPNGLDPAWQKVYGQGEADATTINSFSGMGFTGVNPADPSMDVGPNHIVQMINAGDGAQVQIWDKAGNVLVSSFLMDGITGIAGAGDPIVVYDHMADRWLLTEFADVGNRLIYMVSTTADPTGTYNVYSFTTPNFPDYPKYGLWPNAYIITTNESDAQAVYAVDRAKVLAGDPAPTMQRFADLDRFQTLGFQSATPVNLSGTTTPAVGAPGIIMRIADDGWANVDDDRLELWELTVDFNDSNNSMLTGPFNLLTDPFDTELCGFTSFSCIEQPNGGPQLDPLREVLMNKIFYRNFGSHESIVCCQVTDVDGNDHSGVRWYELRRSGGEGWQIYQQGTFAPDGDSRWMAAIGINADGSIGLSYNVSSLTTFPSLRYTGRIECDPLGDMTVSETTIVAGTASNSSNRYGDYNDMNIDPSDGSFWFTGMYNPSSSWGTYITNYSVDFACNVFRMSTVAASQEICPEDNSVTYNIDVSYLGDFNGTVTFSALGLPAGATASFVPPTLTAQGAIVLTVTDNALSTGIYNFEVKGESGAITHEIDLELIHFESLPAAIALTSPADGATNVSIDGAMSWTEDSEATNYQLQVSTDAGFSNLVIDETLSTTSFSYLGLLQSNTSYFWKVTGNNICGDGPISNIWSFTIEAVVEACVTLSSSDTPIAIVDNTTITSSLDFLATGLITDVNVLNLDIEHTFIGDINIDLINPSATSISLVNRICGSEVDMNLGLDDDGASPIPCPPTTGLTYTPNSPLSVFNGMSPTGEWDLSVTDNAGLDEGFLNSWTLEVCFLRPVDDCDAIVDLNGLIPDGTYHFSGPLTSSGTVLSGRDVVFKSPTEISLFPTFMVQETGLLEASIEDCNE